MINLILGDITTFQGDVIVNAANSQLLPGGGVCGAIHKAAGPTVAKECVEVLNRFKDLTKNLTCPYKDISTGEYIVTSAGNLNARYIFHAVGPIWDQYEPEEAKRLLRRCYGSACYWTKHSGEKSIAFPSISTGIYGFPKGLAAPIAVDVAVKYSETLKVEDELDISFYLFDQESFDLFDYELFHRGV